MTACHYGVGLGEGGTAPLLFSNSSLRGPPARVEECGLWLGGFSAKPNTGSVVSTGAPRMPFFYGYLRRPEELDNRSNEVLAERKTRGQQQDGSVGKALVTLMI